MTRSRLFELTERTFRAVQFAFHALMLFAALNAGTRVLTAPLSAERVGLSASAAGAAIDVALAAIVWGLGANLFGAVHAFIRRRRPARSNDYSENDRWIPAPRSGPRHARPLR